MQKRRLMKLAKMLEANAKKQNGIKFDIETFVKLSDPFDRLEVGKSVSLDCGTTACAMGLAAISGEFKKEGLFYKIDNDLWSNPKLETKWKGRVVDYDQAAVKLFNITQNQANYLFSPWTYPYDKKIGAEGEREVVRRIKRVVAGKKIPSYLD